MNVILQCLTQMVSLLLNCFAFYRFVCLLSRWIYIVVIRCCMKMNQWNVSGYHIGKARWVVDWLFGVSEYHMCCDLAESVGYRELWLQDIARKNNEFLLFSIFLRILQLFVTYESLVRIRWGFQQNVPHQMRTQSNKKLKMSHVRLQTDFPRWHHILAR